MKDTLRYRWGNLTSLLRVVTSAESNRLNVLRREGVFVTHVKLTGWETDRIVHSHTLDVKLESSNLSIDGHPSTRSRNAA